MFIMVTKKEKKSTFLQLGKMSKIPISPEKAILEKVNNSHISTPYLVRFSIPEFTSLCPVTGQPDFAKIFVDYVPNKWLLESKSLKLYMQSFRNIGIFHEDVILKIGKKIYREITPTWIRIGGYFYPRGGIPIDVFWQEGKLPKSIWIPDHNISAYLGR